MNKQIRNRLLKLRNKITSVLLEMEQWKQELNDYYTKLVLNAPGEKPETFAGKMLQLHGWLLDEALRNGNINWKRNPKRYEEILAFLAVGLVEHGNFSSSDQVKIKKAIAKMKMEYRNPDVSDSEDSPYIIIGKFVLELCKREHSNLDTGLRNIKETLTLTEGWFGSTKPNLEPTLDDIQKKYDPKFPGIVNENTQLHISDIKNQPIFVVIEAELKWGEFFCSIYVPHNIVDPADFEEGKTKGIELKKPIWRNMYTGSEKHSRYSFESINGLFRSTKDVIEFESLDWVNNKGFYPKTISDIKKDISDSEKNKEWKVLDVQTYVADCTIVVLHETGKNKYESMLRCMEYHLTNIRNGKSIKGEEELILNKTLSFEASNLIHDYTAYVSKRNQFNKFPILENK